MKGMNAWERATRDCLTSDKCWRLDGEINTQKPVWVPCSLFVSENSFIQAHKNSEKLIFLGYLAPALMACHFQLLNTQSQPLHRGKNREIVKATV